MIVAILIICIVTFILVALLFLVGWAIWDALSSEDEV